MSYVPLGIKETKKKKNSKYKPQPKNSTIMTYDQLGFWILLVDFLKVSLSNRSNRYSYGGLQGMRKVCKKNLVMQFFSVQLHRSFCNHWMVNNSKYEPLPINSTISTNRSLEGF